MPISSACDRFIRLDRHRRLDDVLERGEVGEEIEALKDEADAHPDTPHQVVFGRGRQRLSGAAADVDVADPDLSLVEPFEPVHAPEHRGLAAARRPENGGELTGGDAERGPVQHRMSSRSV